MDLKSPNDTEGSTSAPVTRTVLTPSHSGQPMNRGQGVKSWSPPRPADLSASIQRIEDRRAMAALNETPNYYHHHVSAYGLTSAGQQHQEQRAPVHQGSSSLMLTSPISFPVGHRSASSAPSPPAAPVASNTEVSLLRLELDQRRGEVEVKRTTIVKLEGECSRLLAELDNVRKSEAEKKEAAARTYRDELQKNRQIVEELQQQLTTEVVRRGHAEREALRCKDEGARAARVEEQRASLATLLDDRERELSFALDAKRRLEKQMEELIASDQTNVLKGKTLVLGEQVTQAVAQADALQKALSEECQRREAMEKELKTLSDAYRVLEGDLATERVNLEAVAEREVMKQQEVNRWQEKYATLSQELQTAEAQHVTAALALQEQLETMRSEQRKRMQQIFSLETQVVELQEQARACEDRSRAEQEQFSLQKTELDGVLSRLRSSYGAIEDREAELAKQHVLLHEAKTQCTGLHAELDVVRREAQSAHDALRETKERLEEAETALQEKAAVAELCAFLKRSNQELEQEVMAEQRTSTALRERIAVLEEQQKRASEESTVARETERRLACREEELALAKADHRVLEIREASLKEDVLSLREKLHVAETRWSIEVERRDELDRKLRLLEAASQDTYSVFGKYVALQQYLSSATSETAKAMELNAALMEEVRTLEIRNKELERRCEMLTESNKALHQFSVEAQTLKTDLERATMRAREAEAREAELLRQRRSDPLAQRVHDLESMVVEAVQRTKRAEDQLTAAVTEVSISRRRSQDEVASPVRRRGSASGSPHQEAPRHPQPRESNMTTASDNWIAASGQDQDVSPASSCTEDDIAQRSALRDAPPPSSPLPVAPAAAAAHSDSAASHAVAELQEERATLMNQLQQQQERLVKQDARMEQLSQAFGAALADLRRLKDQNNQQPNPTAQDVDRLSTSQPLSPDDRRGGWTRSETKAVDQQTPVASSHSPPAPSPAGSHGSTRVRYQAQERLSTVNESPLLLAQRQQRNRVGTRSPVHSSSATSARQLPSIATTQQFSTPPRAPSPPTIASYDAAREKMSLLFRNAQQVALASPSPSHKTQLGGGAAVNHQRSPGRVLSPPTGRSGNQRRAMSGVVSPSRFE